MGCFLACFGGSKNRKRRRSPKKSLLLERAQERSRPSRANVSTKQITPKPLTPDLSPLKPAAEDNTVPELKENLAQGSSSRTRKKVTFNLNVQTYDEDSKCLLEDNEGLEEVDEDGKPHEGQDEFAPKLAAFPLNHRYQNCEISDDDGSDCGGDEEEDYSDSEEENEEESYDSFFSLAIDKEPQRLQEVGSPEEPKCPSSPGRQPILLAGGNKRDRSQYVHPVLNPVENLTQWKEVKVHSKNAKVENAGGTEQENHYQLVFCSEAMNKEAKKKPQGSIELGRTPNCSTKQEISVDASLSNWLLSPGNSTVEGPEASNSPRSNSGFSREDRPILGALTVEDLKQASVTSSPRRSPSRSTDESPILGTVGRYWNSKNQGDDSASSRQPGSGLNGSPNTTTKYREDKPVNWNSTPFEVMLERALETGTA
ncbi:hypothetical protein OPV22_030351 [Ensete ventricosum]|uniref:Uncharacterized protein n=1 Tax=Ensete ventricosum TaxID=4639 RepID=A0AAV8QG04_ENSVE|nr:hypothetical protein OPV22_030351 [Ensete ventricosum]